MAIVSVLLAVVLDKILAEPKCYHPLVGFGWLVHRCEKIINRKYFSPSLQIFVGALAWFILVMVPSVFLLLLREYCDITLGFTWLFDAVIIYIAIGYSSLRQHAAAVVMALKVNSLPLAQEKVGWIVSRDTSHLETVEVRRATIESVLENGSDAIFAPLFWFLVGGVPAIVVYRLANTLDAMWGYKTAQFLFFGRFSARMDDILNYIPSRIVGVSYALLGRTTIALQCWRKQARYLSSPNGGVVMAAGAGALNIRLGGTAFYHGEQKEKPFFGGKNDPSDNDVLRSIELIDKTLVLWCGALVVSGVCYWVGPFF
jgi:adenosylcobinamide-phosphate synthase